MVQHWLGCPVNGYLGSDYGSDVKSLLHTPQASGLADGLIAKCRQDVPMVGALAPDAVNVYAQTVDMDVKRLHFEVAGQPVPIGEVAWRR